MGSGRVVALGRDCRPEQRSLALAEGGYVLRDRGEPL